MKKVIDQSVFNGRGSDIKAAAVDRDGYLILFNCEKHFITLNKYRGGFICYEKRHRGIVAGHGYCSKDWQNSLIERDFRYVGC